MGYLSGLEGTGNKHFEVTEFFKTVSRAMFLLKRDGFCTAAGDNGAINVWKDNEGFIRAERLFYSSRRDCLITTKKTVLKEWLKIQLPKIF